MERFLLDQTKFDAIIVGSSLSQTLLAASLSRAGKRVRITYRMAYDTIQYTFLSESNLCLSKHASFLTFSFPVAGSAS